MLEADVNFNVVNEFVRRVTERAVGQEVLARIDPSDDAPLTVLVAPRWSKRIVTGNTSPLPAISMSEAAAVLTVIVSFGSSILPFWFAVALS